MHGGGVDRGKPGGDFMFSRYTYKLVNRWLENLGLLFMTFSPMFVESDIKNFISLVIPKQPPYFQGLPLRHATLGPFPIKNVIDMGKKSSKIGRWGKKSLTRAWEGKCYVYLISLSPKSAQTWPLAPNWWHTRWMKDNINLFDLNQYLVVDGYQIISLTIFVLRTYLDQHYSTN